MREQGWPGHVRTPPVAVRVRAVAREQDVFTEVASRTICMFGPDAMKILQQAEETCRCARKISRQAFSLDISLSHVGPGVCNSQPQGYLFPNTNLGRAQEMSQVCLWRQKLQSLCSPFPAQGNGDCTPGWSERFQEEGEEHNYTGTRGAASVLSSWSPRSMSYRLSQYDRECSVTL